MKLNTVTSFWSKEVICFCLTSTRRLLLRFSTFSKRKSVHLSICSLQTQLMAHLERLAYCPYYTHCLTLRDKCHIYIKHAFHSETQLIPSLFIHPITLPVYHDQPHSFIQPLQQLSQPHPSIIHSNTVLHSSRCLPLFILIAFLIPSHHSPCHRIPYPHSPQSPPSLTLSHFTHPSPLCIHHSQPVYAAFFFVCTIYYCQTLFYTMI